MISRWTRFWQGRGFVCRCLATSTLDINDAADWEYIDGHLRASDEIHPDYADVYGCPDTDALWGERSEPSTWDVFVRIRPPA